MAELLTDLHDDSKNLAKSTLPGKRQSNKRIVLVVGTIIILLLFVVLFFSGQNKQAPGATSNSTLHANPQEQMNNTQSRRSPMAGELPALVYGTWTGENSVIKKTDLSTGKTSL